MNYSRYFEGKKPLARQAMVNMQTLSSMYRGRFFDVGTVSEFNRLTKRFNAASTRAEQERTLDERQRLMLKVIQGSAFNRLAA